jgi:hypothetical protein
MKLVAIGTLRGASRPVSSVTEDIAMIYTGIQLRVYARPESLVNETWPAAEWHI